MQALDGPVEGISLSPDSLRKYIRAVNNPASLLATKSPPPPRFPYPQPSAAQIIKRLETTVRDQRRAYAELKKDARALAQRVSELETENEELRVNATAGNSSLAEMSDSLLFGSPLRSAPSSPVGRHLQQSSESDSDSLLQSHRRLRSSPSLNTSSSDLRRSKEFLASLAEKLVECLVKIDVDDCDDEGSVANGNVKTRTGSGGGVTYNFHSGPAVSSDIYTEIYEEEGEDMSADDSFD